MRKEARIVGARHNILCTDNNGRREHYNLSKTTWLSHCNCRQSERVVSESRMMSKVKTPMKYLFSCPCCEKTLIIKLVVNAWPEVSEQETKKVGGRG